MSFVLQHTHLGFCWLDLVALVILLVVIGVFVCQHRKLKNQKKELEEQLSGIYAKEAVEPTEV